ncbi:hypothetical protein NUU61_001298 [Penicillium alfredii]|uniref:FAD-binding domain-containing protein n=1 Tax=Penicillium alfredii TaxID=1506179 RepID=A0A9W9G425_9EURO|nr:uncharacterized protein NUU61_001298 [Penicillium alfredii]KAJ5111668.1 hypothetical protein NUU61_001298 [Penicillium alfredii]
MDTFRNTTSFVSNSDKGIANKAANHMTKNAAKGSQARHDSLGSTAKQAATIKDESVDLLIIGAGPAGLIAACWAAQYDMSTRIIDRKRGPTKTGHADGLQSRTLEILESFGIVDPILKQGVPDVDTCHWATKNSEGIIERQRSFDSEPGGASRFGQVLLSQGAIERVLNDYLIRKGVVVVEWNKEAVSLHVSAAPDENPLLSPITVGVKGAKKYEERIHARYLVACDGAHSWTGNQLNALTDIVSEDSTWGVLDIIPITDFRILYLPAQNTESDRNLADIRRSCSINSQPHGSIMTVPRENRLVRFYIHLRDLEETAMQHPSCSPGAMVEMAKAIMKPYDLTYNHCDWWSIYPIGRRLARHYIPQERVFLAGDAAHTHSPKGGQGMNVSIQDTYNLMWKLAAVITNGANAMILATYDSERRPVAKTLMDLDSRLVQAYEMEEKDTSSGIYEIRGQYAGFIAGIDVTYSDSILVTGKETVDPNLARNIKLGARLPSFLVVFHCDGAPVQLAQRLVSDGAWRLLVFPGDLPIVLISVTYSRFSLSGGAAPTIEFLLIQSCPRSAVNLLDLPELFHPYDDFMGWDYWRVFADDRDQAYTGYGIDKQGPGCLVLCRPDQHVAWVGGMEDVAGLDNYFSIFIGSSR